MNVRSDIASAKNEILNTPILKDNSVLKSAQSGVVNQSYQETGTSAKTKSFYIYYSNVDLRKTLRTESFSVSVSNMNVVARISDITYNTSYIKVDVYIIPNNSKPTVTLTGEWQIIEFY